MKGYNEELGFGAWAFAALFLLIALFWASVAAAQATILTHGPKRDQAVSQAYLAQFAPIAGDRVRWAAFRLAHLIITALTGPVQNSIQKP